MMKKKRNKHISAGLASVMALGTIVAVAPLEAEASINFSDVESTHQHYDAIINLAERGIIKGFGDGTFKPGQSVTRGQAAKIIAGVLELDTTNVVDPGFTDVPTTHEYYGAIAALENAGIIKGYGDGTFGPGKTVTRNHMAKIIANAFELDAPAGATTPFEDVSADSEYAGYITALYTAGITTGTTSTTFSGTANVTRGQMASFVVRAEDTVSQEDAEKVAADKALVEAGTYEIPLEHQTDQAKKTAWVQSAVDALLQNGTKAEVTFKDGVYGVVITLGDATENATITVTEEAPEVAAFTIGEKGYDTLQEAVDAAENGDIIKLNKDATGAGIFLASGRKNVIIDFDKHTYTVDSAVGSTGTETQAVHLEQGNTVKLMNGTITSTSSEESNVKMLVQNYSDLTLEDMTLDGTKISEEGQTRYVLSNNSGTVAINGATSITANPGDVAVDSCKYGSYEAPTVNINTTGTITGELEVTGGNLTIEKGAFTDLSNAVKYAAEKASIKLAEDTTGKGIFLAAGEKDITIDFDKHTYTVDSAVGSTGTETQAVHLEKGNTVKLMNGTITSTSSEESDVKMLVQNYSNLTLEDMTLDGTKISEEGQTRYVLSNNSGIVAINGATSITANPGDVAVDSYKYGSYEAPTVNINTTGTITGKIEVTGGNVNIADGTFIGELSRESGSLVITGGAFTDLSNAVTYTAEKASIKLAEDTTGKGIFLAAGKKDITVDFDKHTYTVNDAVGSTGTETQAVHLEKGNTVKLMNGTITSTSSEESNVKMLVQNYSNLTLEDMTLDGTKISEEGQTRYVLSNNAGIVAINGVTSITANPGDVAVDSYKYGSYEAPTVNINTTGTITGKIEVTGGNVNIVNGTFIGELSCESGSLVITGGAFTQDPNQYTTSGYTVIQSHGEQTIWVVEELVAASPTLDAGEHFVVENGVVRFLV